MTISSTGGTASTQVDETIREFLETRLKIDVRPDLDLFASGTASSMFAMELVVHLEQKFGIAIVGPDLVMDNFRTIESMSAMVHRLRDDPDA
ncbi:acyl carrier protein [Cryptosporangium japonicum]|uniref:Carrier domain-containing protein n=1 Tax=Cryptosporangium japonicum TaxID=80872 RepID=A0ABN0TK33_9ACTN